MQIVLYSTHCPKCRVLESKLKDKGIEFKTETDVDVMIERGYTMAPVLVVDGNEYEFGEAVKWINESGVGV